MPETLTLEDKPTLERLSSEHPDTHEALRKLPPHVIEHVGGLALKLTHIDMHPVTVTEYQGKIYKEADYTKRILDGDNTELELEQGAIEAAKAGKEKLSQVLHSSSATLALAHAVLVARGYSFEAPKDESEEDCAKRHAKEKKDIAEAAYKIAADRAIELKRSGSQQALIEQLEALNAIAYLSGSKIGDKAAQMTFRRLVHEGLADDMLLALQASGEIGSSSYDRLNSPASMQKSMLQLATGKNLDYDFSVNGDLDIDRLDRIDGSSPMLEVLAVITSPHIEMPEATRRKILEKMSNWSSQPKLKLKLDSLESYSQGGEYFEIAEACENFSNQDYIREVMEVDDPVAFKSYAEKMGLSLAEAMRLIAPRSKDDFNLRLLDVAGANSLIDISDNFPELFKLILEESKSKTPGGHYGMILKAANDIRDAGIDGRLVYRDMANSNSENISELTRSVIYAFEYAKKKGLSPDEFVEKMSYGESGEHFYWKLVTLLKNTGYDGSPANDQELNNMLDKELDGIMIESSINKAYGDVYEKVHYPASPESVKNIRLGLESFPEIASQLRGLGLDDETSRAIFASWATFNALQKHGYNDESGFVTITEMPGPERMKDIVREQSRALKSQLEAIKKYQTEYGTEELNQVISIFGIYNFNRHAAKSLHNQLERWNGGQRAETVVAEARADWNSYTGKPIKFEDESDKTGTFYFEVNSSVELSRLAVMIGQRERQNGREPDVNRFVVHAHGNPTGLLLGVNGERLLTSDYKEASQRRSKISGAEANDYRRHLGPNFKVILQSCSGAGETSGKNIAATMAGDLDAPVTGAVDTITGLVIKADGTVEYEAGYKETVGSITYDT